ncbi:MAG: DNA cytosine methyltransferase [Candidatus Sabulitectum sp.]|nr:DNA cytosine methyltransferase [Candidatus Sabulitectum sp.]
MDVDLTKNAPTVLSLCSGYGGLEIGVERVLGGLRVLAHVEIEAFAIANLVNKMETGRMVPAPIWTDLKSFRSEIFRGHVDILTGGYPCQPFSAAGKRKGKDDPRHLFPYIIDIIKGVRPRLCFFENVEGHISLGLREVLESLEEAGYTATWGVFSAAEVGAPHQRKRVFILAHRVSVGHERRNSNQEADGRERQEESAERDIFESLSGVPGGQRDIGKGRDELAHTDFRREQRREYPRMGRERQSPTRWPARPGEEQYEWEEPRIVGDTQNDNGGSGKCEEKTRTGADSVRGRGSSESSRSKAQRQLGGAINGVRDRVDRLRLCGNGVVPQTAEKAFRTLIRRIL